MKKSIKSLIVLLIYCLHTFSMASVQDLEWQRIEVEKLLDHHYSKALSTILERGTYQVKTTISYSDPGMPNFDDLNRDGIKISEVNFDDSKGDYIAFSKVGLEVPVVKKFYKENQAKLKELYRYQDSYNLFKNLDAVNLKVTFSDNLQEGLVESAKKVIQTSIQDIGGVITQVNYEVDKIKFIPPPVEIKEKPDELDIKDYIELLGKFGNAIGLILATLLLGGMVYFILKKYLQWLKEMEDNKNEHEQEDEEILDEDLEEDPDLIDEDGESENIYQEGLDNLVNVGEFSNFEKVISFMDSNPNQFSLMIKRWINENGHNSKLVLTGIIQQLDPSRLNELQAMVTPIERSQWLTSVEKNLDEQELQSANKLIIDEIVREMVSDKGIDDYELLNILIGLEPQTAISFINSYPKEGGILLNLLSSNFTSKILQQMDEELLSNAINNGLNENIATNSANIKKFKVLIMEFKKKEELKPFNFKIAQILPQLNSEKEKIIYDFMRKSKQVESIIFSAQKSLPSELILNLPSHILKFLLQNYPLESRVQLLVSLPESDSEALLNIMASVGSSAREMIQMELDTIINDEVSLARFKKYATNTWQQFINYSRTTLETMPEYREEIDQLIKHWAINKAQ